MTEQNKIDNTQAQTQQIDINTVKAEMTEINNKYSEAINELKNYKEMISSPEYIEFLSAKNNPAPKNKKTETDTFNLGDLLSSDDTKIESLSNRELIQLMNKVAEKTRSDVLAQIKPENKAPQSSEDISDIKIKMEMNNIALKYGIDEFKKISDNKAFKNLMTGVAYNNPKWSVEQCYLEANKLYSESNITDGSKNKKPVQTEKPSEISSLFEVNSMKKQTSKQEAFEKAWEESQLNN